MKTKAVRMYGTRDLRLEEFELPEIKDDEMITMDEDLPEEEEFEVEEADADDVDDSDDNE